MGVLDMLKGPILNAAADKLKELFGSGIKALVIIPDPEAKEPPLPGYRCDPYDEEIVAIRKTSFDEIQAKKLSHPWQITDAEKKDYDRLLALEKEWSLKGEGGEKRGSAKVRSITTQPAKKAKKPIKKTRR